MSSPVHCPFLGRAVVLIPALNEASCLGGTIRFWQTLGAARVRVVDNGSTDQTSAVARSHGVEVVREPRRGYGAAAWRGLRDWPANMDWVLFSSADGSDRLTPTDTLHWQAAIDHGADLIVGDRTTLTPSGGGLNAIQRIGNGLVCRAIRFGWGRRFRDMGSLRLIRHDTLVSLNLADREFGWNVEMQIRALQLGLSIVELPVRYYPRESGTSKISGSLRGTVRAGCGMLRILGRLWGWRRAERHGLTSGVPVPNPRQCP